MSSWHLLSSCYCFVDHWFLHHRMFLLCCLILIPTQQWNKTSWVCISLQWLLPFTACKTHWKGFWTFFCIFCSPIKPKLTPVRPSSSRFKESGDEGTTGLSLSLAWQTPPQVFLLGESMKRGAWQATIHRVAKSCTWLNGLSTHPMTWHCQIQWPILSPIFLWSTVSDNTDRCLLLHMFSSLGLPDPTSPWISYSLIGCSPSPSMGPHCLGGREVRLIFGPRLYLPSLPNSPYPVYGFNIIYILWCWV